jgi:hypothetical protein
VYEEFGELSGIDFGSVIPTDLMESDLRFDRCAGDFDFDHVERFAKRFRVRKKDVFDGHPEVRNNPSIRDVMLHLARVVRGGSM